MATQGMGNTTIGGTTDHLGAASTSTELGRNGGVEARKEEVADRAHGTVDRMASAMHHATDRLSEKGGEWMEHQDELLTQARTYVREQPMMALGMAFAVGFVISRIMR